LKNALFSYKCATLISITVFILIALIIYGPLTTPARYTILADQRSWLGIPNAWNVLSNIPFVLIGIWGLWSLLKPESIYFNDQKEKLFYVLFFIGVFFVSILSSYYHWMPNNYRLMWDRFPIAFAVSAVVIAIMSERINLAFGRLIIWPFLLLALFSVYYWYYTITLGREDLRIYSFILIFLPITLMPLVLLLFKSPYTQTRYIWFALITFILARISEAYDFIIYNFTQHAISGHSLKHLLLALSCLLILIYLIKRKIPKKKYEY